MHIHNKIYVLIITFLLHVSARIAPSSGRTSLYAQNYCHCRWRIKRRNMSEKGDNICVLLCMSIALVYLGHNWWKMHGMENFNTFTQNQKSNNLKWIYHVKSTEHDSNQLGICSMLIEAIVKSVKGHTWINCKTNWLRSTKHRLIQKVSLTETNQESTVVITDTYYTQEVYLNSQMTMIKLEFFSKSQYAKINNKPREIARNLNWW
jgi:hypothetical protein